MKKLKWILLGLLVVIVAAVAILWLNLNSIVRSEVQSQSAASLNVPTTLAAAHVNLLGGSLSLKDFDLGAPPGFSASPMFSLGTTAVHVSYSQLRNNPVRIDEIDLDQPHLLIEQSGGKLNVQALMDQPSTTPPPSPASKSTEPLRLIIGRLKITGADVAIKPGLPGLSQEIHVPIPAVDLADIGTGDGNQNGVAIKQVVSQVMSALLDKTADSDKLPPELKALFKLNAGQLRDAVKQQLTQELGKINPGAAKAAGDLLNGDKSKSPDAVKNGLNDLLGSKKEKKDRP